MNKPLQTGSVRKIKIERLASLERSQTQALQVRKQSMQSMQSTPAMQLVQRLEALEAAAQQGNVLGPFEATEYVPLTVDDLKARAIQATEESQADKGIDHTLHTCGTCGGVWRSKEYTLCGFCAGDVGTILFLDYDQCGDLHDAAYAQEEPCASTEEQLRDELEAFRVLFHKRARWYDRTSRKMIQACYRDLCTAGGTSSKVALAIHFFKVEWKVAFEEKNTFFPGM